MSCCQQNMFRQAPNSQFKMQMPSMENFTMMSPTDYEMQKQTYEIDAKTYYSPPWPAQRTGYDTGLQNQFNVIKIPDYLNFIDVVKKEQGLPEARPSIKTGRYDNYSY